MQCRLMFWEKNTAKNSQVLLNYNPTICYIITLMSLYLRPPLVPPTQDVSTGGGKGTVTVEVEISPMMARASFRAW